MPSIVAEAEAVSFGGSSATYRPGSCNTRTSRQRSQGASRIVDELTLASSKNPHAPNLSGDRCALLQSGIGVVVAVTAVVLGASVATGNHLVWLAVLALMAFGFTLALPSWVLVGLMLAASTLGSLFRLGGLTADNYVVIAVSIVLLLRLRGRGGVRHTDHLITLGLGLMALACVFASLNAGISALAGAWRFASYLLAALHLTQMGSQDRRRLKRAAVAIGAVAAGSVLLVQVGVPLAPTYVDRESALSRSGGLVGHPNFAAYVVAWVLLSATVLADSPVRTRAARIGLVMLFATAILSTGSRLALVALVLALLYGFRHRFQRKTVTAGVLGGALLLGLTTSASVERLGSLASSGGLRGENSAGWRFERWTDDIELAHDHLPWGVGWNQAQYVFADGLGAHNGYLQVAIELGVIGSIGAVALIVGIARSTRRLTAGSTQLVAFALLITIGDPGIFYPAILYLAFIFLIPDDVPAHATVAARTGPLGRRPVGITT